MNIFLNAAKKSIQLKMVEDLQRHFQTRNNHPFLNCELNAEYESVRRMMFPCRH